MCNFTAAHFHLKGGGLTVKATLFDSRIKSVTRHAIIVNFYKCVAPQMWPAPWYCDSVCTSWTISLKKRRPDMLVSRGCFPFGRGILFVPNVTHPARKLPGSVRSALVWNVGTLGTRLTNVSLARPCCFSAFPCWVLREYLEFFDWVCSPTQP